MITATDSAIIASINSEGYTLAGDRVTNHVAQAEEDLRRALVEIQRRVTTLLSDLDSEMPYWAVQQIASATGASGPIGSQWETAIAKATKIQTILDIALVRN